VKNFAYTRAKTLDDAVAARAEGARLIAGGTELLNWLRLGIDGAEHVVDITRLAELRGISRIGAELRIGALTTLNEIEASVAVRENAPVLSQACLKAASAQLRNLATIGGNVLQKTRCPYFRCEAATAAAMPWPCNKRVPGSGCAAFGGHYDRAAVFGWTDACVANQPSDPAVALAALDATVEVVGTRGARSIPMTEFHLTQAEARDLPRSGIHESTQGQPSPQSSEALLENRLRADEVIIAYRVPIDAASRSSVYLKVRERESYEYALVSAAVCLEMRERAIHHVRIALGSVAQKPWRLDATERALIGEHLATESLEQVLTRATADARALPGQEFKLALARNAVRRALFAAGGVDV
jgi:xanthine dehydrogenase YagS FAD-binding subunit